MNIAGIKTMMCEIPMFDLLKPDELTLMASFLEYRRVPPKTVLMKEGTPGDSVIFIVAGKVDIRKEAMDGSIQVISTLGKGTTVGEMSLVQDNPLRAADAVSSEEAEVLYLTRGNFEKVIQKNPPAAIRILRNIASTLSQRLSHLSGRYADNR